MKAILKPLIKLDKKEEEIHNLSHEIEGAKDACGCGCLCPPEEIITVDADARITGASYCYAYGC